MPWRKVDFSCCHLFARTECGRRGWVRVGACPANGKRAKMRPLLAFSIHQTNQMNKQSCQSAREIALRRDSKMRSARSESMMAALQRGSVREIAPPHTHHFGPAHAALCSWFSACAQCRTSTPKSTSTSRWKTRTSRTARPSAWERYPWSERFATRPLVLSAGCLAFDTGCRSTLCAPRLVTVVARTDFAATGLLAFLTSFSASQRFVDPL